MFGSDKPNGTLFFGELADTRVTRWALHTQRRMKNLTPMNSDTDRWVPATGGGFCALRGWIEGSTILQVDPGRYDFGRAEDGSTGIQVQLFCNAEATLTDYYYKFDGRLEMLNIAAPVDGPQNFAAVIRVDGDIEIKWS